jgi:hypothetical protein
LSAAAAPAGTRDSARAGGRETILEGVAVAVVVVVVVRHSAAHFAATHRREGAGVCLGDGAVVSAPLGLDLGFELAQRFQLVARLLAAWLHAVARPRGCEEEREEREVARLRSIRYTTSSHVSTWHCISWRPVWYTAVEPLT